MALEFKYTKSPLIIKIPMKPYVVKFLLKKFGKSHKASKNSWLGLNTIELLTKDFHKPIKLVSKNYFTIVIPYTLCIHNGHFVDYSKFPKLEKKCDKIFRDFMYDFVQINSLAGNHGEIMNSLRRFLSFYDISEDDLKLESAYRHYQRTYLGNTTSLKHLKKKVV